MARPTAHKSVGFSVAMLLWALLISTLTVSAQATATPINVGENKAGEIVDPDVPVLYTLTIGAPMSVNLQVLAITSGFAPNFRVLDPAGVVILDSANAITQAIVRAALNLSSANAAYTIEVHSANNTAGQFLISLEAGAALAAPQPLTAGTPVDGRVDEQTTRQAFTFSGLPSEMLLLAVRVTNAETGVVIALRDADSDDLLSLSSARLGGINYRILSGEANYLLEVTHSGGSSAEQFVVCLATESGSVICPGLITTPEPTATPEPVTETPVVAVSCTVASNAGGAVNLRSGNGTQYAIVGSLPLGQTFPVLGQNTSSGVWYQVDKNGTIGWVAASVTRLEGDCAAMPVIAAPVNAQLAPTSPPVIQPTDVPPTAAPSTNPTAVSPANPTDVPTPKLPDLTVRSLRFSRDSNGNPILKIEIMNSGTASLIPQTFSILGCFDGFDYCNEVRVTLPLLPPNIYTPYDVPLPEFDYLTQHSLNVTLDGRGEISELDEHNNTAYTPFG